MKDEKKPVLYHAAIGGLQIHDASPCSSLACRRFDTAIAGDLGAEASGIEPLRVGPQTVTSALSSRLRAPLAWRLRDFVTNRHE